MKPLIVGLALIIFSAYSLFYFTDYNSVERTELVLKIEIDEAASGAVLMYDAEQYGEGNIVFDDEETLKYVSHITDDKYSYIVHIFDDSLTERSYCNDGKGTSTSTAITFPCDFVDGTGYRTTVDRPSIILEAKVKGEFYTLKKFKGLKDGVQRSSMYVVEGR